MSVPATAAGVQAKKSGRRSSADAIVASSKPELPHKSASAKNHKAVAAAYRFHRGSTPGIIEVLNENSYVMAEYNVRTGSVMWQRIVLASQREQIERWLEEHYPNT